MSVWVNSIKDGLQIYGAGFIPVFLPLSILAMVHAKKLNIVKFIMNQMFFLYLCCVFALVFLPLPDMKEAANLTYKFQLIPLHSMVDVAKAPTAFNILQVAFNVVMTIPFGMSLRYYFKMSSKKVLLLSLALTAFIEIGQLTGLYFMFQGSYRLFDVDDLICNTLGGMFGYAAVCKTENSFLRVLLPELSKFDKVITLAGPAKKAIA